MVERNEILGDGRPGGAGLDGAGPRVTGRVRLQTLVVIRWLAVAGQSLALVVVRFAFDFDLPFALAMVPVGASALLNLVLALRSSAATRLSDRLAALYLAYDLVQLAVLLYLTGGLLNPFSLLFLVPVTISATILTLRSTVCLGVLAGFCVSLLAFFHLPLPWPGGGLDLPNHYLLGIWSALLIGMVFMGAYAWRVAAESRRMADALSATHLALAREQRLSALDGLAAAAAHELGTPLGTITVVANELARELPPGGPLAEDVALLIGETERCRQILARLSRDPRRDIPPPGTTTLAGLVEAAAVPYRHGAIEVRIDAAADGGDSGQPVVPLSPEILHGLRNLIENAVDFARSEVRLMIDWNEREIGLKIGDDGPGIPANLLGAMGEPYLTSRSGEGGMGLGVFIAKTLLERTGARVVFGNRPARTDRVTGAMVTGAMVAITWPRGVLEVKSEGIES